MVQHRVPCFVIADGGHARFVYAATDNALHTRDSFDSTHVHDQSSDLGSDRPGRSFESSGVTRHALAPRHDPHEMAKIKFEHFVATQVCKESAADAFNELILVAPAHVLNTLKDGLDGPTAAKLVGTLAKDLTKVPDGALDEHLTEWVRPTLRAA